jgi:ubiquinone/menaquinone biosynthesis C-methylase UbiE
MNLEPEIEDKSWYDSYYGNRSKRELIVPPDIVERYFKQPHPEVFCLEKWHQLVGDVRGKKLLYIGCGVETSGILLALRGGEVWALDVSSEALRWQRKMALANGTQDRIHDVVGSCERLPFPSESFDLVVGIGILHHLQKDLETPCSEVARVLKKDGWAIFQEPIARSPHLRQLRKHVPVPPPEDASQHCRPLTAGALDVFGRHFHVEAHYYRLFGRLDRLLDDNAPPSRWRRWTVLFSYYLDYLVRCVPGFGHFASVVVLKLARSRKKSEHGAAASGVGHVSE